MKHCDDYIDDETQPIPLRRYLSWARLSASLKYPPKKQEDIDLWISKEDQQYIWKGPEPKLFAKYNGKDCQVVMASRFGDVGIHFNTGGHGYSERVAVEDLTDFASERPCSKPQKQLKRK